MLFGYNIAHIEISIVRLVVRHTNKIHILLRNLYRNAPAYYSTAPSSSFSLCLAGGTECINVRLLHTCIYLHTYVYINIVDNMSTVWMWRYRHSPYIHCIYCIHTYQINDSYKITSNWLNNILSATVGCGMSTKEDTRHTSIKPAVRVVKREKGRGTSVVL